MLRFAYVVCWPLIKKCELLSKKSATFLAFDLITSYSMNYYYALINHKGLNNNHTRFAPTLSLGIIFKSLPNFRKTSPQFWSGFMPTPSIVRMEVVFSSTRNYLDDVVLNHRRIG